jgi:hypothetical protein
VFVLVTVGVLVLVGVLVGTLVEVAVGVAAVYPFVSVGVVEGCGVGCIKLIVEQEYNVK